VSLKSKLNLKKSKACQTVIFSPTSYLKVYLVSDTGFALARCNNCGPTANGVADTAAVYGKCGDSFAQWRMFTGCDGQVAFQSIDTGKYIARCRNCWQSAAYVDGLFIVTGEANDSVAQFTMISNDDGTYGFKGDLGNYLARCHNCVTGATQSDFAFEHTNDPTAAYARWKVVVF
jgi:hypothetical protein